jgi:hypothetical protein
MAVLTKSLFMIGRQCAKRLWFEVHQPLASDVADSIQLLNGREFDRVAQGVREGMVISRDGGLSAAVEATQAALSREEVDVFYQAAFRSGNIAVISDVLRRNGKAFDLVENKVSTKVTDDHLVDVAFQALVLERLGVRLKRIFIGHVNNGFRLRRSGQYRGLVKEEDVTAEVRQLKKMIRPEVEASLSVMASASAPGVAMGGHCESPYRCPFMDRCNASLPPGPEFPVSILPRGGKIVAALMAEGIIDLKAVPAERFKSRSHRLVHAATLAGAPLFDEGATREVRALAPPYSYLDFETLPLAVPRVVGTGPYEQCPFQWSLHVEEADGTVRHIEHLSADLSGGLEELARTLLRSLPSKGPIFVYNATLERGALNLLARLFPALRSGIKRAVRRIKDLLPITRASYCHPLMRGSWSIKDVLPTIDPQLAYAELTEVKDGGSAQAAYLEILESHTSAERRNELEARLKDYCGRDTYALIVLRRFLCQDSRR